MFLYQCWKIPVIETERLILRTWKAEVAESYFKIDRDPKVIEFLPSALTMQQVKDFINRATEQFNKKGYTLWAAEEKTSEKLKGFIGLNYIDFVAPFTPAVEIGWRLGSEFWGKGYATEVLRQCFIMDLGIVV